MSSDLAGWTIAFDLDGTLVDSAPDLIGTLNRMLTQEGLPPAPIASASALIGSGARALLIHGFEAAGADTDRARSDELFERFMADYATHIADGSRPYPGVVQTLDRLAARGAKLVVATNKRSDLSELLIEALGLTRHFGAVIGPDRVSARKPSGAHLIEAVQAVGGDPARAIMVGDAAPDTGAARDARMPCVVVTYGYTPTPPRDLGGTVLIDALGDLETVVGTLVPRAQARRASSAM